MPNTSAVTTTDLLLFVVTSILAIAFQKRVVASSASSSSQTTATTTTTTCDATTTAGACVDHDTKAPKLKNSAFVFIKPHANTPPTRTLVTKKLTDAGITIVNEISISGKEIDEKKLIDQHYYSIASKATILSPNQIPVPVDKFGSTFGEKWEDVLKANRAVNAMEACDRFGITPEELNKAWSEAEKMTKFGGGFYCGLVSVKDKESLYVFNGFFMSMRSKFVGEGTSIHCYVVEWDPEDIDWEFFRGELLGPTDPAEAPIGSIRRTILDDYKELGLSFPPYISENGVHASASPFEALAEKINWLGIQIEDDAFGKALLDAGITKEIIEEWSLDPQVELENGNRGSIFDELEDMDAMVCWKKMLELYELNADVI